MADLVFEGLSFTYTGGDRPALSGVDLTLKTGSFTLLCGPSGCGKSTLLRHVKPSLTPRGERQGRILLGNELITMENGRIGFVTQQTFDAIVTDRVFSELAFGPEQMGMAPDLIRRKIAEIVGFFGMNAWLHQDTATLSGGQAQLLNLAAVLVADPDWLVLDEPTAQLDPQAEDEFLRALTRAHRELGVGVLIAEHRPERLISMADRLLVMEEGRITLDDTPERAAKQLLESDAPMAQALPAPCRLAYAVGKRDALPMTVAEGRQWLAAEGVSNNVALPRELPKAEPCLAAEHVCFRYEKEAPDVLDGASLTLGRGEAVALLGANGAGKSTLLALLAGALKPWYGRIKREKAAVGWLPQDARLLMVTDNWWADWARAGASEEDMTAMATRLHMTAPRDRHPFDLSGGELQRAALGKLLLGKPGALLLDEPTKGLDCAAKRELAALLRELTQEGVALLIASHDLAFCAEVASRAVMLFDGQIVSEGEIHAFFSRNLAYTTPVSRMARDRFDDAITVEEVVRLWPSER